MCGIYGAVTGAGREIDGGLLQRMSDVLVHRGPDGNGVGTYGRAALGCRRLAIIDVAGGAQPLHDEAGDVAVVCNGEIYNAPKLRRELEARGHRFRTRSDVEVVPHLYEERGLDFLEALEGMFGLALWDARAGRLVLARDRLGEKPLYYAAAGGTFFFASEPGALFASGGVTRGPDWSNLAEYLRTGYVASPASAFADVAKLPPGAYLVLEGEHMFVRRYWEPTRFLTAPSLTLDIDDAARALREHLERAVASALVSDVPVGVFLSGGLDSTTVATLARPSLGDGFHTFSLGFDEAGFDERDHARAVAQALGTHHHTLTITPASFLEGARALVPRLGEPLADPALVPTYLLAQRAREEVEVVLVGEGADELFAGYPTYVGASLARRYRRLSPRVRRALSSMAPRLGASRGNTTLRYMAGRFVEAAEMSPAARHREWTGCFTADGLDALLDPKAGLERPHEPELPPARSELDGLLGFDIAGYLSEDLLVKLDRATMAASIEGRAPFLDRALVEFACRLPADLKLRGLVGKRVLRRAVADIVPGAIRRRVKRGLTVPLAAWIAGPLAPFVTETLARLDGRLFRREAVRALFEEHLARRRDNRREIWALVVLQLWAEA